MKNNYKYSVPGDMKKYKQWIYFKKILISDKHGEKKIIKLPVSPVTLESKGWNNEDRWTNFDTALEGLERSDCHGLAFVLSENDPFVCIDLDDIHESKRDDIIDDFSPTYIEKSLSGKGYHIFVKGTIKKDFNNQDAKVEMYSKNKCISMTGDCSCLSISSILEAQEKLDKYYEIYGPREKEENNDYARYSYISSVPDMNTVIDVMRRFNSKAKALYEGSDLSGDLSKDDFRLLLYLNSFTNGNKQMMKDIFLQSALNRIDDRGKRRSEGAYLKYLDNSIINAMQYGNSNYWNYDHHMKRGESHESLAQNR